MEQLWYYTHDGQSLGPVSFDELKKLTTTGQLLPGDSVCPVGSQQWQTSSSVVDLFPPLPLVADEPVPVLRLDESDSPKLPLDDREPAHDRDRGHARDDRNDRDRRGYRDRDDRDDPRHRANDPLEVVKLILRRAFSMDLQSIQVTDDEARELKREGLKDSTVQRYAVWRKSLLWFVVVPTAFAAIFHIISLLSMEKDQQDSWSRFGLALLYLQAFSILALPITAGLAASKYTTPRKSTRLLFLGAIIAFAVPVLIALVPAEHLLDAKVTDAGQRLGVGIVFGLMFYLTLLPTVLSLLPAVCRACIKLKTLVPSSIAPGWALMSSAPLYVLIGFATFILIYQIAGNFLLVLGVLLWVGAPLIHLYRYDLWIRPLTRTKEIQVIARMHLYVMSTVGAGVLLIIIFLLTAKIGSSYLVGFDKNTSAIRPWNIDLHAKWVEFVGRSFFLTVVFADLVLGMNVSIWKQEKEFYRTEAAADYDKEMENLQEVMAAPARVDYDGNADSRDRDNDRRSE